ncbi:choline kinase family protein [Stutzerimonas kirkiae]|uniref:Choline/ethanolamine kinase--aminoglycoside phosphotransferase n=1 Tax=Stutzerimonas kirkiae TaxID=2211392 RepID=A0A4Q9RCJ3_9GAMM|nr:choline kinase family protein [Stutzerimonas kirkiae]TBU98882.1 choline/ethanolamine kinase--aminoglycoside phosphotransferase [Stutzerimonas kirkiae]TBV03976.1 choline/ethanolamine kinase--aminoglycoside phosphotransferase [Stutzerimonas kirkiae]TBV09613.1 choline/ethanolamine kinase--aminoglycoside phosphotransferase [Stutzerimonas kirkiae]TBV16854.1 choline/ethanolamine kinase--aminoglycoside phosphotransferase [Stutzerimonas kirkiae]
MKTLGTAQTPPEQALEAAIHGLPEWRGKAASYAPVSGGISNTNWRVHIAGAPCDYFVKIPGTGTEMFIRRDTAHDASLKAAATGYGVPVVGYLPEQGVEIFEFIEGWRPASNRDFLERDVRLGAARGLKAFNSQGSLIQTKTVFDMIDEHYRQVRELGASTPPDHDWLTLQYQRARQALEASGLDLVPCMNDTLAGNFMLNQAGDIRLVDFEYASNNDRHYELALWFGEMFFPEALELEVIEDYFGAVRPRDVARIKLHKALADLKWSTWAMVQRAVSSLEFDYYKYGFWKHMRARSVMRNSQWESWLRQV